MKNYYKEYSKYKEKYVQLKSKNMYEKHLSEPWYTLIEKGIKTVEGRPNKGDFKNMKIGDIITFFNINKETKIRKEFKVKIINKKIYKSFYSMIDNEGIDKILPDPNIKSVKDGVNVYRQWYSNEIEKKYGVVAIHIKLI